MKYVIDIDGTICKSLTDYESSIPIINRIKKINTFYDNGDTVIYFTARGMGRCGDDPVAANTMFRELTESQLSQWGCKYHQLILGKPSADIYIDDRAVKDTDFFGEL